MEGANLQTDASVSSNEEKKELEKSSETIKEKKISKIEWSKWYDKYYKVMLFIPLIVLLISLVYLGIFYTKNNDFVYKDVSLTGGTTITINSENLSIKEVEMQLSKKIPDMVVRSLSDISAGRQLAIIIESSANISDVKTEVEKFLGYELTEENSSIEFTGSAISSSFYKQLLIALFLSFVLMSVVVFIAFRNIVPCFAVIFAAFSDIVMPLALMNLLEIKLSSAGIAAFLMLIGYSVDTDILLTSRVLRRSEPELNKRIYSAFKTGITMTLTSLAAVAIPLIFLKSIPYTLKQIFLILSIGLSVDIFNTWLTNTSILKLYCEKRGIK